MSARPRRPSAGRPTSPKRLLATDGNDRGPCTRVRDRFARQTALDIDPADAPSRLKAARGAFASALVPRAQRMIGTMPDADPTLSPPADPEAGKPVRQAAVKASRQAMPVVAIVGRPNVGKSSLLNALVRRRIAIVQDMPGVTRDRVSTPLEIRGKWVELIDTGGYGFVDEQGLTEHIRGQIEMAMRRAELVVFIVDAHEGVLPGDEIVAQLLRRLDRKVLLVANKADGPRYDLALGDFARLGFGTPLAVSATVGRNVDELVRQIGRNVELKNAPKHPPEPDLHVTIVGKRNAGKSTLVNAIARLLEDEAEDRVIDSEVPGTT